MAHKHPLTSGQMRERQGGGVALGYLTDCCRCVCVCVWGAKRSGGRRYLPGGRRAEPTTLPRKTNASSGSKVSLTPGWLEGSFTLIYTRLLPFYDRFSLSFLASLTFIRSGEPGVTTWRKIYAWRVSFFLNENPVSHSAAVYTNAGSTKTVQIFMQFRLFVCVFA